MSKPLVVLDVIEPRKKLLEHLELKWDESYKDFRVFRKFLEEQINTNPLFAEYKGRENPCPYGFVGTTSCGTIQITMNDFYFEGPYSAPEEQKRWATHFAKKMAWAVANLAPNFIYWAGESLYAKNFELLEKFGASYIMRSYNLVHNHFCREYHLSYDYPDAPETSSSGKNDDRAYQGYCKLSADIHNKRPKLERVPKENYDKVGGECKLS